MKLPLQNRLKKRLHVDVALLQDELAELLYQIDPSLVFHGGTCIWRCYGGNRFSEDLDFYSEDVSKLEDGLSKKLAPRGFSLLKMKKTGNVLFAKVANGNVEVRVEANYRNSVKPVLGRFEKADGSFLDVLTLPPETLILEKMRAYGGRRLIRDIYDVYHLADYADNAAFRSEVRAFLSKLKPPHDEENLQAIVYSGVVPSFAQMVEALKRRFK